MQLPRSFLLLPALVAVFFLSGCASTPERRIAADPETFRSFPSDVQEAVRQGQIDIGFTPEMVRIALGEPSYITTRRSQDGTQEFWIYEGFRFTREMVDPGFGIVHSRYFFHRPFPTTVTRRESFVRSRIEFIENAVISVEQLEG